MTSADTRRAVLRELIRTKFGGVARQLAIAAGKPEGQINDMLANPPRKAFGEKVARQLEQRLGLDPGYFDLPANTCAPGKVAPFISEAPARAYGTGPIAEVVAIMETLSAAEQQEALGAIRYIEYESNQRRKNSTLRAGQ